MIKMYRIIITTFVLLILIILIGCHDCKKCFNETYTNEPTSSDEKAKLEKAYAYRDSNELWLKEPHIQDSNFESYRLIFVSYLNQKRNLIRLDKRDSKYFLIFKDFSGENKSAGYQVKESFEKEISASDWNHIEELIYKHHFWTAGQYKTREVLDGYGFILEGRRPYAKLCGKKTDQAIFRGSPDEEDEMGILCWAILDWYNQHSSPMDSQGSTLPSTSEYLHVPLDSVIIPINDELKYALFVYSDNTYLLKINNSDSVAIGLFEWENANSKGLVFQNRIHREVISIVLMIRSM